MNPADFLTNIVLPAFVGGGSAWLLLQFLGEKIISHRLAKDLERYKIELTERTDVLKTQLSIFSHEQTVAISRVDSQRSEAIHKVYAAMREVINPATLLMSGTPFVNADEAHDLRFYGANAELAHAACGRLVNTLADLAIYFDNDTYKEVMLFVESSMDAIARYLHDLRQAEGEGAAVNQLLHIAEGNRTAFRRSFELSVNPRAKQLTGMFRQQLGIEVAPRS